MGKLMHNRQIKHSSHPHLLQLSAHQISSNLSCAGCDVQISPQDHVYTCRPCNFFLHPSCSKFPQLITHPSHREHALSLIPTPIYPGGFFRCDACTQQGTRFSYHCSTCDYDLHVLCSSKPLSVNHPLHSHPLVLTFSSPYGEKIGFSCDVCHSVGSSDQWLYHCFSCEFDVHLHCASAEVAQPSLQHNHSYPGAAPVPHPNQYMVARQPLSHSVSTGHAQTYWQPQAQAQPQQNAAPGGFQSYQCPSQPQPYGVQSYQMAPQQQPPIGIPSYQMPAQQPPVGVQSYQMPAQQQPPAGIQSYQIPAQQQQPVGVQSYQMQQQQPQGPPGANQNGGLADVMMTGFVEGMAQQLGQDFVQSHTGGGAGGGGGGDGGGGGYDDGVGIEYQSSTDVEYQCSADVDYYDE